MVFVCLYRGSWFVLEEDISLSTLLFLPFFVFFLFLRIPISLPTLVFATAEYPPKCAELEGEILTPPNT